jgi:hypothetical protein
MCEQVAAAGSAGGVKKDKVPRAPKTKGKQQGDAVSTSNRMISLHAFVVASSDPHRENAKGGWSRLNGSHRFDANVNFVGLRSNHRQ